MPIYEYRCPNGHLTEELRSFKDRNRRVKCDRCGRVAKRIPSAHHAEIDGIYSYAPNVGTEGAFERKRQAIREGVKLQKKVAD